MATPISAGAGSASLRAAVERSAITASHGGVSLSKQSQAHVVSFEAEHTMKSLSDIIKMIERMWAMNSSMPAMKAKLPDADPLKKAARE